MQQLYNCFQRIRRSTSWSAAMRGASARTRLDEMLSAFLAKSVETFTLELPKGDTAFLKTLARKMGWTLRSNRRKMSAYERSLDDESNGRVNHYASSEEFFNKMGI